MEYLWINFEPDEAVLSSLLYVEVPTKQGGFRSIFATQNMQVVQGLLPRLDKSSYKAAMKLNPDDFRNCYKSIEQWKFKVVTAKPEVDGFVMGTETLNFANLKIRFSLMFNVGNHIDLIYGTLLDKKLKISYADDEGRKSVVTTLNYAAMANWLQTQSEELVRQTVNGCYSKYCFGSIVVSDISERGSYRIINVYSITNIQIL